MKPEIGTKVYMMYRDGILVDEVAFLGKDSFVISCVGEDVMEDSLVWEYENFNKEWFLTLEEASDELISYLKEDYENPVVVEIMKDFWYEVKEGE